MYIGHPTPYTNLCQEPLSDLFHVVTKAHFSQGVRIYMHHPAVNYKRLPHTPHPTQTCAKIRAFTNRIS